MSLKDIGADIFPFFLKKRSRVGVLHLVGEGYTGQSDCDSDYYKSFPTNKVQFIHCE